MMKNNKKICVVGASGLVGSSIARYALERGYFVNGTLTDKSDITKVKYCLLYTSPSPRDRTRSRMPSSA